MVINGQEIHSSGGLTGRGRSLENKVRRAVTFSENARITPADPGFKEIKDFPQSLELNETKTEIEVSLINKAVAKYNGNLRRAADGLGITRPTLYNTTRKRNMNI